MSSIMTNELRIALRRIWGARMSSALVFVTLALVGGVSAAVSSVAYRVYLHPLSYPNPDDLVRITGDSPDVVGTVNVSPPDFRDLRARLRSFASLSAVTPFSPQVTMTGHDEPRIVDTRRISSRYFATLGVPLIAGREFVEGEEQPPARPVILSEHFWKQSLNGDHNILGRVLTLNGDAHEVIGIAPDGQHVFGRADVWMPMQFPSDAIRGLRIVAVVGRRSPAVAAAAARSELIAVGQSLQREYPATNARWQPVATPLAETVSGSLRSPVALTAAVILVLWIAACAAIGGLSLSATLRRASELTMRRALGAGAWQLLRVATCDHLLIGAAGIVAAVLISEWIAGAMLILGLAPSDYVHDWRVSLATAAGLIAIAIGTTALGSAIAWRQIVSTQRHASSARRPRQVLLAAQVAMAITVVGVSTLLFSGLMRLQRVDPGFAADGAAFTTLTLPPRYSTLQTRAQFWDQLIEKAGRIAGVREVALTSELPFTGQQNPTAFTATTADGTQASVQLRSTSASYFRTAGIVVRRGRAFDPRDDASHSNVVIINQQLADVIFHDRDPIGQTLTLNFAAPPHRAEIVGIVSNTRHGGPTSAEAPEVYAPAAQTPLPRYTVLLRTNLPTQPLSDAVGSVIRDIDPNLAVTIPSRWTDAVAQQLVVHRTRLLVVACLAIITVLLATLSVFGTVSESVNAGARDFAVRIALGASPAQLVRRLAVDLGGGIAVASVAGIVMILLLRSAAIATMSGVDLPRAWPELAALFLVAVAVAAAAWLPGRSIMRIDPANILRS